MKTIKSNGTTILAIQIFQDCKSIDDEIFENRYGKNVRIWDYSGHDELIELPPGSWRILGLSNELSEEQKPEVCEAVTIRSEVPVRPSGYIDFCGFRDYGFPDDCYKHHCTTLAESYASFLTAHNLKKELILIEI